MNFHSLVCYIRALAGVLYHAGDEMICNVPLVHSTSGVVFYPYRKSFYNQISGPKNVRCTVDIVNRDWDKMFRLVIDQEKIIVNNKYDLTKTGNLELIDNELSLGVDSAECRHTVNDKVFRIQRHPPHRNEDGKNGQSFRDCRRRS